MPTPRHLLIAAAAALLSCGAWPAQRLAPDVVARYGGSYATDCANPAAPRLRVLPDALVVERDGQRIVGREPDAAYSYFGSSPAPRGFDVALLTQGRGSAELTFLVSHDRNGSYIETDGPPTLRAMLGPGHYGRKFRPCDGPAAVTAATAPRGNRPANPSTAAPAPAPAPGGQPEQYIADPRFRQSWRTTLGAAARDPWLAGMDGPAPPPRWVDVAGTRYVLNAFCKPHDCADNNVVQLYAPASAQLYALVHRGNRDLLAGNPPPPVIAALQRLWKTEWRQ